MNSVLLLCDGTNERTDYLTALIEKNYHIEYVSDVDAVIEDIRTRSEEIFAIIIDHPAGNPRARELVDYVQGANSYLFAIPVLVLTDPADRDADEDFLSDTVISAIEVGQSERSVNQAIRKANDTINTFSFQEFSRMLKALPSLIYLKDSKARYVFCSQYWHHLSHYDDKNWTITGKTDFEIRKDALNAKAAYDSDMHIIESGVGGSYIIEENDDGYQEFLQIIKEPVRDADGKVRGIIAIINNVTEQETLRRELKKKSITDELTGLYNRAYFDEFTARLGDDVFPLGIISAVASVIAYGPLIVDHLALAAAFGAAYVAVLWLLCMAAAAVMLKWEGLLIKGCGPTIVLFPLFLITWLPINIYACLTPPPSWRMVPHTRGVSLEAMEDRGKVCS